jgi:polyisoprenoid-binding protein YceI
MHGAPDEKERVLWVDAYTTINREEFGVGWGKAFGFDGRETCDE